MSQPTEKQPQQDRGPGAQKVELERRLDANSELEKKAGGEARPEEKDSGMDAGSQANAGNRSPSDLDAPEYYSKDSKPVVAGIGTPTDED